MANPALSRCEFARELANILDTIRPALAIAAMGSPIARTTAAVAVVVPVAIRAVCPERWPRS